MTALPDSRPTSSVRPAPRSRRHRRLVWVGLATVATDLSAKIAAVQWLQSPADLGVITLRTTKNSGIAFGAGAGRSPAIIITITGIVVAAMAIAAWRGKLGDSPIGAGLIVGGGVANLADRLTDGSVIDIFDLGWWPVFNLADVALIAGILLAAAHEIRQQSEDQPR